MNGHDPDQDASPTMRVVVDDMVSIHAYRLPPDAVAAILPLLDPPSGRELLSRRLVGTAQRTPDGWAVTTADADTALYHDGPAAIAAILGLDLHETRGR